ncbi:JID1 J domain-containing protein 1 [Candida maltosa Xu316]|uniref:DNAJ-like HSP40 co-chaperone, putative n=1 Tax=Candida maltosa (strain Xu316) TaxID=1245528 RepID=M3JS48_CANMX|nr:DNAJ-like HSP40 co-chaperone, putative [Candida maltosa Xu316]
MLTSIIRKSSINHLRPCFLVSHYATAASEGPEDHHKRLDLHDWPKSKNPTPYEIFGISSNEMGISTLELNKILKKKYFAFVKIYHPDTSLSILHDGVELSPEMKRKRFDMIQEAYDILKNPRRRVSYNRYHTTSWEQQGRYRGGGEQWNQESFDAYRRANAHRTRYNFDNDEQFWQAGTWQDYYQMKYKRPPPTKEEFEKNKYKILAGVLLVGALGFGLQIMGAIDRTNQYLLESHRINLKTMRDLNDSYDNYGEGHTEADTLRRFLVNRRSTMKSKQHEDDIEKEPEPDDDELLRRFAVKRVQRWDRDDSSGLDD